MNIRAKTKTGGFIFSKNQQNKRGSPYSSDSLSLVESCLLSDDDDDDDDDSFENLGGRDWTLSRVGRFLRIEEVSCPLPLNGSDCCAFNSRRLFPSGLFTVFSSNHVDSHSSDELDICCVDRCDLVKSAVRLLLVLPDSIS